MTEFALLPHLSAAFTWAVSSEVTGVLQWLGTVIAVVAIPATFFQSRRAATAAAEAASAVRMFQDRLGSINVAHSYSHLELAKGFLVAANYSAALIVMGLLKREIVQIIALLEQSTKPPLNLRTARRNLSYIETQLVRAVRSDPEFKQKVLDKAVDGLGNCLLDWENRYLTHRGPSS